MSNAIELVKRTFGYEQIQRAFEDNKDKIARETAFAIQAMEANPFLAEKAAQNPKSLAKAIMNIALTGISLNPVQKYAYLVPRSPRKGAPVEVCLDFSYRGLSQLAIDAGAVLDINTQIVYERDSYSLELGSDPKVTHSVPFGDRGEMIGVYSSALLHSRTYHIEAMSIHEIKNIMRRSSSFRSGKNCPWITDFGEMARKTVIKRLFKYLPIPTEVMAAVQIDHETNPALAEPVKVESELILGDDMIEEG